MQQETSIFHDLLILMCPWLDPHQFLLAVKAQPLEQLCLLISLITFFSMQSGDSEITFDDRTINLIRYSIATWRLLNVLVIFLFHMAFQRELSWIDVGTLAANNMICVLCIAQTDQTGVIWGSCLFGAIVLFYIGQICTETNITERAQVLRHYLCSAGAIAIGVAVNLVSRSKNSWSREMVVYKFGIYKYIFMLILAFYCYYNLVRVYVYRQKIKTIKQTILGPQIAMTEINQEPEYANQRSLPPNSPRRQSPPQAFGHNSQLSAGKAYLDHLGHGHPSGSPRENVGYLQYPEAPIHGPIPTDQHYGYNRASLHSVANQPQAHLSPQNAPTTPAVTGQAMPQISAQEQALLEKTQIPRFRYHIMYHIASFAADLALIVYLIIGQKYILLFAWLFMTTQYLVKYLVFY